MDLLEVALKHSIDWSLQNRLMIDQTDGPGSSSVQDELARVNSKIRDESHVRAFVSHFKIQLNNLMGSKLDGAKKGPLESLEVDEFSSSDHEDFYTDNDDSSPAAGQYTLDSSPRNGHTDQLPVIRINGKRCSLYDIGKQDDDYAEYVNQTIVEELKRESRGHKRCAETDLTNEDTDDGYRSLSRGSFRSNLVQQLNEIKSRLLDLVHEIDLSVRSRLAEEEVEAYKRRWDALISRLDALVDSCAQRSHNSSSTDPETVVSESIDQETGYLLVNSSRRQSECRQPISKNNSESNLHLGRYEEQVQVIDYDFRRRSSDNSGLKRVCADKSLVSAVSFAKLGADADLVGTFPLGKQLIDFGAMMRDYEIGKDKREKAAPRRAGSKAKVQPSSKNGQHVQSSSSTSSHSASSHASSSSFL